MKTVGVISSLGLLILALAWTSVINHKLAASQKLNDSHISVGHSNEWPEIYIGPGLVRTDTVLRITWRGTNWSVTRIK